MRRHPVSSTSIMTIGYERDIEVLEVEFLNGRVYQYHGVPERLYRQIINAPSVGRCFHALIRNQYPYSQV